MLSSSTVNGIKTEYSYVDFGAIHKVTQYGKTYTTQNYFRGVPREERDQLNRVKKRHVYSDGTIAWESNWGESGQHTYSYDNLHRVTKVEYPGFGRSATHYDYPTPNVTKQHSNAYQFQTESKVDGFGRPLYETSLSNISGQISSRRTVKYAYNAEGQLTYQSDGCRTDKEMDLHHFEQP